jgi:hypothetical protein
MSNLDSLLTELRYAFLNEEKVIKGYVGLLALPKEFLSDEARFQLDILYTKAVVKLSTIKNTIDCLLALQSMGYPNTLEDKVSHDTLLELQMEASAIQSAITNLVDGGTLIGKSEVSPQIPII